MKREAQNRILFIAMQNTKHLKNKIRKSMFFLHWNKKQSNCKPSRLEPILNLSFLTRAHKRGRWRHSFIDS